MHVPGAKRYIKKYMWKADKFDIFESVYLTADQPLESGGGKSMLSSPAMQKFVSDGLPIIAVCGLVVGGGYGSVKLDSYMKKLKDRWREEEIELYGEELTVDATPVEVEDVELPDDDEDDDDNENNGSSENGNDNDGVNLLDDDSV